MVMATFTDQVDMLVEKTNDGFGMRSWRYDAIINDGIDRSIV